MRVVNLECFQILRLVNLRIVLECKKANLVENL